MNKLLIYFLLLPVCIFAQSKTGIVSGPMLGQIELRTATIWAEVKPGSTAILKFWKKGNSSNSRQLSKTTSTDLWYAPIRFELVDLEINTPYEYSLSVNGVSKTGSFQTRQYWDGRGPAFDFSFLSGSCAYSNDPKYDWLEKPKALDSSIFLSMAKEKSKFMVWLGDNWYTRDVDYGSAWGLWYRASYDRSRPVLQDFLKSMSHYAIWDDHDYGPNNSDKTFGLASESKKIFTSYWTNPFFGLHNEGIYTLISYSDVDLFLMDDRSFRSSDDLKSEVDGHLNSEKLMWGKKQLDWLKNALTGSTASFKIIVSGSQFLNKLSETDCLSVFPVEYNELMNFLQQQKIEGVVFLSGDRHHSEIIQQKRPDAYTLYDITTSPLTSRISRVSGNQLNHPDRIPGSLIEQQNFARFSISGAPNDRQLMVEFAGIKGEKLASWSVKQSELMYKK